ncbi:MAG: hypothetical protein IIY88_08230, partial [Eubacterium sp.]|nr:hypothetical protein [Eubacterium sp.]
FNSESADVFQNEPDGNRAGTINNTTAKPRHVEQTAFENQKQSRKEDYSLSETNKYIEKLADGLSIFVVFAFIAGGALTLLGLYKVMVYKEYVGGDAYNLIIRAIHFASCFMLAAAGYISGAVAMVGQKIILANIKPVAQVKEKEKESVKYDEELPMI